MYEVLLHPDTTKVYAKADKPLANKIAKCLQKLEQEPRLHPNIKLLRHMQFRIIRFVLFFFLLDALKFLYALRE
jgi:mRNA-degrading endonuclease RelE of RelBE toxin-antitoxin system